MATAGEVFRCDLLGKFNDTDDVVNAFEFRLDSPGSVTDALVLDDIIEIMLALIAILDDAVSILVEWQRVRVQVRGGGRLLGEGVLGVSGGATGDPLAPGVAGLVSMGTTIPRVTLRKYFGPFSEASIGSDGRFVSAIVTVLANAGNFLRGSHAQTSGNYTYGYFSPKTSAFETPNSTTATNIPAYQRRRRQGRGS